MKLSFSRILLIVFLILLVCAGVFAFNILNRPSTGLSEQEKEQALTSILGRPVMLNPTPIPQGNILHTGKYVSFMYPTQAKVFAPTEGSVSALDYFAFDVNTFPRVNTVTTVIQMLGISSLDDYPGVRARETQIDLYQSSKITADSQSGVAFDKYDPSSGFEKTGFFLVNGNIYTFSVSGVDKNSVQNVFNEMIATLKFL